MADIIPPPVRQYDIAAQDRQQKAHLSTDYKKCEMLVPTRIRGYQRRTAR